MIKMIRKITFIEREKKIPQHSALRHLEWHWEWLAKPSEWLKVDICHKQPQLHKLARFDSAASISIQDGNLRSWADLRYQLFAHSHTHLSIGHYYRTARRDFYDRSTECSGRREYRLDVMAENSNMIKHTMLVVFTPRSHAEQCK